MAKLGQFGAMTAKFSSLADFITVYISEAHPSEEANFTGNIDIAQHKVDSISLSSHCNETFSEL